MLRKDGDADTKDVGGERQWGTTANYLDSDSLMVAPEVQDGFCGKARVVQTHAVCWPREE